MTSGTLLPNSYNGTVQVYSANEQSLPSFEAHWSQTRGGPAPYPGAVPGMSSNPYPSVAYPSVVQGSNPYGGTHYSPLVTLRHVFQVHDSSSQSVMQLQMPFH
jgi:hypothetical protein